MSDRREKLDTLLAEARALPKTPGVYLMKDQRGRVIYVGKATRLADRVASYFVPSADLGPQKQRMIEQIADFDTVDCQGEWEALLTENRLIKDIHPPFNARLVDDKTFPYLVITTKEDFPGVYITRQPNSPQFKGAKVYGPFTNAYALREAVSVLQKIFKFRTCHLDIDANDDKRNYFRPCLLYPIKQCTAPCAAKISKAAYRADIQRLIRFLDSKRSTLLKELRQEMAQASADWDFEKAATLRDQIGAIEKLEERGTQGQRWQPEAESLVEDPKKGLESLQKTLAIDEPIRCVECIDIAHLQGGETVGSKVCFVDGRPLKNEYRRYKIKQVEGGNDDYASIREVVGRRYREAGQGKELYPDVIVIDGGLGQLHAAMEALEDLERKPPMVISLAKKDELIYTQAKAEPIKLSRNNQGLKLVQAIRDEAHRFAQHYHHILRRKKMMGESK
jgi:excinuclease ABC subunit C